MVWNWESIAMLKDLWRAGHSTSEIGTRLGCSKNAVVGKAHREDLDGRPSPIRRDGLPRPAPLPIPQPLTALLPLLSETAPPKPTPAPKPFPPQRDAHPLPPAPAPIIAPRPIVRRCPDECCWPIGMPGKPEFRFCAGPSLPGKPYCEDHAKLAYVKVRDRPDTSGTL